jgi:ABC-type uncharacterized transport system substrate-binding protein
MKRRTFISLLGGAAVAWPHAARAQQGKPVRRIGVLLPATADDPVWQARFGAFLQALALLGWTIGRNVHIDTRWATSNAAEVRRHAAELAALAPDVILAGGTSTVAPLLQAARNVPIVFTIVNDPVGVGLVDSLARPGGNATGFMVFEFSMAVKWLELLKEIAPGVKRVAVLRDATQGFATSMFAAIQGVAPSLAVVEVIPVNMRAAGEIEQSIETFARAPNGGLIPIASAAAVRHRDLIVTLPPATSCRRSTGTASSSRPAALPPMGLIWSTSAAGPPAMSIASCGARSRPTCPCRRRPCTSW